MEMPQISLRQAFWLFVNSRFIITLVFIPQFSELHHTQDLLYSLLLNLPMDMLFVLAIAILWKVYPDQTILEYSEAILGRWPGKMAGLFYLGYFFLQAAITARVLIEFLTTRFFPNTPDEIIGLGMLLVCGYCVYMGLEVLGRCADAVVPFIFLFIILFAALTLPEADWMNAVPTGEADLGELLLENIPSMTRWSDIVYMAMIFPYIAKGQRNRPLLFVFGGLVFLRIVWLILMLSIVAIFGPDQVKSLQFPTLEMVQVISIDFLERIDAFALGMWVFGSFLKISLIYYIIVSGSVKVFELNHRRHLILPAGLIIFFLTMLLFANIVELRNLGNTMIPLDFFLVFVFPCFLLLVHALKKKLRPNV